MLPIYVLILCPTRELASQIAAEANVLLKHHDGIGVLTLVGGTRFKVDQKRLESDPCQVCICSYHFPTYVEDQPGNCSDLSLLFSDIFMEIIDVCRYLLQLLVDCWITLKTSLASQCA